MAFLRFYRLIINENWVKPELWKYRAALPKKPVYCFLFLVFFSVDASDRTFELMGGRSRRKVCFSFRKAHLPGNQIYLFKSVTRYLSEFRSFVWKWNLYGWKVGHEVAIPSFSYIISYANVYSRLGVQRRGRDDILY